MVRPLFRKVTIISVVLCLLLGGVGFTPKVASITGSSIAKAKTEKVFMWVKPGKLKVYKTATTSSKVVATLKKDDKVVWYTPYPPSGSWAKVCYKKGKFGYVKRSGLKYHCSIQGWKKHAEEVLENLKSYATNLGYNIDYCSEVKIENREFDGNHYKVVVFSLIISNSAKKITINQHSSPGDRVLRYTVYLGGNSVGGALNTKEVRSVIEDCAA